MEDTSAIILAAGYGSRLGVLTNSTPKPLLLFDGLPFIEYVIRWLMKSGIRDINVICSVHYEQFEPLIYSNESFSRCVRLFRLERATTTVASAQLGLQNAFHKLCFILTCDSLWTVDLRDLYDRNVQTSSLATVLISARPNFSNYGAVKVLPDDSVIQMWPNEGTLRTFPTYVRPGSTMGLYLVDRDAVLSVIAPEDSSIEREPLNRLIPRVQAVWNETFFLDFGTPESYHLLLTQPQLIRQCWGLTST